MSLTACCEKLESSRCFNLRVSKIGKLHACGAICYVSSEANLGWLIGSAGQLYGYPSCWIRGPPAPRHVIYTSKCRRVCRSSGFPPLRFGPQSLCFLFRALNFAIVVIESLHPFFLEVAFW